MKVSVYETLDLMCCWQSQFIICMQFLGVVRRRPVLHCLIVASGTLKSYKNIHIIRIWSGPRLILYHIVPNLKFIIIREKQKGRDNAMVLLKFNFPKLSIIEKYIIVPNIAQCGVRQIFRTSKSFLTLKNILIQIQSLPDRVIWLLGSRQGEVYLFLFRSCHL